MSLREICTPDVVVCGPDITVLAAARIMRQRHVGDLVVVGDPDGDQTPLGLITDRDIVLDVLGRELDPGTVRVHQIMRKPVVIASDTETLPEAVARMRSQGVRRLPVMGAGGKLLGIVSLDDLLRRLAADASALVEIITCEQDHEHRRRH